MPSTDLRRFYQAVRDERRVTAVSLWPDAALKLAQRYGCTEDEDCRQAAVTALNAVGVRHVFFCDGLAQAQRAAEAAELLRRLELETPVPLILSGCPSCRERLIQALPEHQAFFSAMPRDDLSRSLAIRWLVSAREGVPFSSVIHVTVVGCAAQKDSYCQALREPGFPAKDEYVLTLRELCLALTDRPCALPAILTTQSVPAAPEGQRLFAVLAMAAGLQSGNAPTAFSLTPLPGRGAVREGALPLGGRSLRYAQIHGLQELPWLMEQYRQRSLAYDLMEVFACAGCR